MAGTPIGNASIQLTADTVEYINSLQKAQKETNKRLKKMEQRYEKWGDAINKVGAVAIAGTFVSAVVQATQYSLEMTRELERSAEAAGLTIPEFQAMAGATSTVGINMDQLGSILGDTEEKIGDFIATGGGGFNDFVDVMGLTEEQAIKTAKELQGLSGRDVLIEMTRRMQEAGVSSEEMNFALEGMASDSRYLLPLLKNNATELKKFEERVEAISSTLSEETTVSLSEAALQTTKLTENASNFISTVAQPLVDTYNVIAEAINKWLAAEIKLKTLLGQDDEVLRATIAGTTDLTEARELQIKQGERYSALLQRRYELEDKIANHAGSDTTLGQLTTDLANTNKELKDTETNLTLINNKVTQLNKGSGATGVVPKVGSGSGSGGGDESSTKTFGEQFGGTDPVDTYALNQYKETEDLKHNTLLNHWHYVISYGLIRQMVMQNVLNVKRHLKLQHLMNV